MPSDQEFGAHPVIEIDGTALPESVMPAIEEVVVDDHLHLPDMFALRLRDDAKDILTRINAKVGAKVVISATAVGDGNQEPMIIGEVTALEAEFDKNGTFAIVRGYDLSHRLTRGRRTKTYRDVTDADIATEVATAAGLQIGQMDPTSTIHEHVAQVNCTDWDFLKARAAEIGYEMGVVLGKFTLRKRQAAADAPSGSGIEPGQPLQLALGSNLEWFRPRITAAEQVGQYEVRGWDPEHKQAVVATADAAAESSDIGVKPADLASTFGTNRYVAVDLPLEKQAEADSAVKALAEQVAGAHVEADAIAHGNPNIKAGSPVAISLVGAPFDGKYVVTGSTHRYTKDGYRTHFQVSGRQERSLLGLASMGATNAVRSAGGPPVYGVVVALVTDVKDPMDMGRVKVTFPWLSADNESWWARVTQLGAGKDRGAVWLPEVNDEVLVAFEQGDTRRPIVIGSLYNGVDKPPLGDGLFDQGNGAVKRRGFVSKAGHKLVFLDDTAKSGIAAITANGGFRIALNQSGTKIHIASDGTIEIEAKQDIKIKSISGAISIEAATTLELKASAGIKVDGGGGNVAVSGAIVNINS